MAIYPTPNPPGTPGAEIDPSRRFGLSPQGTTNQWSRMRSAAQGTLNPNMYNGSTAMNPPDMIGFGPNAQAVADGEWVYWGRNPETGKDKFVTKSQANNAWFVDEAIKKRVVGMMNKAFPDGWTIGQAQHYWSQSVSGANYGLFANNQYLNPLDVLPSVLGDAARKKSAGAGGGAGGPSTTTQVRLTDPQGARALIDNALSQYLGRRASAQEQAAFLKALNVQEARQPTVTTSVPTGRGAAVVTTGGFNPSTFAEEYARGMEGSAEFQAATTYLDSFIQALRPVVP